MNILFLANDDEGLYKFRKELICELLKRHKVFISLPYGKYVDVLVKEGCIFIDTEFNRKGTNPVADLKLISFYRKIMKENKIDAVLTYTLKPNVYGGMAAQSLKIPYVANITGLSSTVEKEGILKYIVFGLYRFGLKNARMVFFQNETNMKFMLDNKLINNNYDLIPGSGVNLQEYEVMEYPDGDTIDFVYIARIMKEKGFEQYCDCARYIRAKYPNTRFHVCGTYDEEEYKPVMAELEKEGILIYHGSVENMKEIYSMISCTIHASYYAEGMSNALLESLACGRPIITTDKPGCRELVRDGINGYLIKQKDSKDLIEKVERFLSLPVEERRKMGLEGRRLVEESFSRDIVIKKYVEVIES